MNTNMLDHPAVQQNIRTLEARGVRFVQPGDRLPGLRLDREGPARRTGGHRRGGRPGASAAAVPRGAARARDGRADLRGPRPRAVHRQPVQRPDGVRAGPRGGQARGRRHARGGAHVDRAAARRRNRAGAKRRRDARCGDGPPRRRGHRHHGGRGGRLRAGDEGRPEAGEVRRRADGHAPQDTRHPGGHRRVARRAGPRPPGASSASPRRPTMRWPRGGRNSRRSAPTSWS